MKSATSDRVQLFEDVKRWMAKPDSGFIQEYKTCIGSANDTDHRASIAPSELYFVWKMSRFFTVETVVESGTYLGWSALRYRYLWPKARITTIDKRKRNVVLAQRLHVGKNIEFFFGKLRDNKRMWGPNAICVIDGPKMNGAVKLAYSVRKRAHFIAIHDMANHIEALERRFMFVIHSGFPRAEVQELDAGWNVIGNNGYYGAPMAIVMGEK